MFYLAIIGDYDAALVQVFDKISAEQYINLGYVEVSKEQFNQIENAIQLPEPFNSEALSSIISVQTKNKK